jgi:hypothetical protein
MVFATAQSGKTNAGSGFAQGRLLSRRQFDVNETSKIKGCFLD